MKISSVVSARYYWLGAEDYEGWRWIAYNYFFNTSDKIVVNGWTTGEPSNNPDEDCAMITINGWYNIKNDEEVYPLCEKDMP